MEPEVKRFLEEIGHKGGTNAWKNFSPEERAKEMSRRRMLGFKKKKDLENREEQ